MAGLSSRPSMNTIRVMVPRETFIAAYVMSNRKHGTWNTNLIERQNRHRNAPYMIPAF
jgi:hypothetical protein